MSRRADPVSLVAGLAVLVIGGLLLLDQEGVLDLSLGVFGAIVSAVIGTILLVSGLADGGRDAEPRAVPPPRASPATAPNAAGRRRLRRIRAPAAASIRSSSGSPSSSRWSSRAAPRSAAYVLAWIFMGEGDADPAPPTSTRSRRWSRGSRSRNWRVAAGVGFLTLSGPAAPARGGHLVVGRARLAADPRRVRRRHCCGGSRGARRRRRTEPRREPAGAVRGCPHRATEARRTGLADVYRGGFGVALVLGAALLFLYANGVLGQARDVVLAVVVAALALG